MKKKLATLSFIATLCLLGIGAPTARAQDTQRFTADINGATISYTVTGTTGDSIVLIHGYPLNGDLFERQRTGLSASYRVIAVDLRGFGQSTAPDSSGTIDLYANDVLALMDQIGIAQAVIGGHSMGGAIALRMYELAPARFLGMILNDAAAMPPPTIEQFMWRGYQRQVTEMGDAHLLLPLLLPEFLTGRTRATRLPLVVKVSNQVRAASVNGLIGGAHALETRPDFTALFPNIAVPVLILWGEEDSLTPVEQAKMLNTTIPNSSLSIVEGASHGVIREKAGMANKIILSWLASHIGTGGTARAAAPAASTNDD